MSLNFSEKVSCTRLKEFGGCNIDIQLIAVRPETVDMKGH